MLTDTKLRNLKPKDKLYKVNDRDGLYVAVTPAGTISFRYNYAMTAGFCCCLGEVQIPLDHCKGPRHRGLLCVGELAMGAVRKMVCIQPLLMITVG